MLASRPAFIIAISVMVIAGRGESEPVPFASLSVPLQNAVKLQSSLGPPASIDRTVEDGDTNYDVVFNKTGTERHLTFDSDAKLTWYQVSAAELPGAIRDIIHAEFKNLNPVEYYRVTEDDDPYYDIEIAAGNATNSLSVAANGRWWSLEIDAANAPAPVRAFIERTFGKNGCDFIEKTKEDGKIYYEAEGDLRGQPIHLDIAANGTLVAREEEVGIDNVAPPARKTLDEHFKEADIISITRRTENNDITFEVEADGHGQTIKMIVGRGGRIRSQTRY